MQHSTPPFTSLADLASARVGGRVVSASDDFFAPKSNLVKPDAPVFIAGKFTARGKWMDGWESRRRRTPGHDWCVVKLGMRGRIRGVDVDTSFFTGNYPSHCSIDAVDIVPPRTDGQDAGEGGPWTTILPKSPLRGDSHNFFAIEENAEPRVPTSARPATAGQPNPESRAWTHLRLNMYPDGGIARLRVYGESVIDWTGVRHTLDLVEIRNGGLVLGASDMHFGAKDNMIMPGRAKNMGDGWETRRRRGPGHDWAIVKLGTTGVVRRVEIDTNHFKGNYPDTASLDGCLAPGAALEELIATDGGSGVSRTQWIELLPQTKLAPHRRHFFAKELKPAGPVSHVRLNIFPDGGISRLRVYGSVAAT